jgi:ADP-ribose pyrophosphatase
MVKEHLVYQGRVFSLFKQKKRLPNGCLAALDVIKHPGAVLVIPFLNPRCLIMLRQFRPVLDKYLFELPAGGINKNETPLACARRELIEEAGFAAGRMFLLGKIYPVPGYSTEKIAVYRAEGLKPKTKAGDSDEIIERRIFTKTEIKRLFKAGKITDAKTISALALCGWL